MSLRHEHNGGNGGGGDGQKTTIVSPDESIKVVENENETEVSVDWTKAPIETEDPFAHVEKDADGIRLSFDLVTETQNGIARAFDKKILDHSFANTAYMGSATKASEAIETHVLSEDQQYIPEFGQILGWQDANGKLRLSRMSVPSWGLPMESWWIDGCYDSVHGTLCIATSGDPSANGYDGDFCIAVRRFDTGWKVVRAVNHEKWNSVCYGNGLIVITTGNASNEFAWSSDGGYTWTSSSSLGSGHWKRARFNPADGYFYFVASERILRTNDLQNFTTLFTAPTGAEINDICFLDNGSKGYLYYQGGETYFRIDSNVIFHTSNFRMEKCIYVNGYLVCWYISSFWITKDYPSDHNLRFHDVLFASGQQEVEDIVAVATSYGADFFITGNANVGFNRIVRKVSVSGDSVVGDNSKYIVSDYMSATHLFLCENDGEDAIFLFGGASFMPSTPFGAKKSQWGNLLKYDLTELPPQAWEEIPVLDEKADGLLCAINGEFTEVKVENDYLKYTAGNLTANHSDRYTEYANYRLIEKTTGDDTNILWCVAELSAIVDGSTYVYDDEECTNSVGIITRSSYNPNNPNDVEVQIDGVTSIYDFQTSKIPVSLATTKAIISALNGKLSSWVGESANLPPVGSRDPNTLYVTSD